MKGTGAEAQRTSEGQGSSCRVCRQAWQRGATAPRQARGAGALADAGDAARRAETDAGPVSAADAADAVAVVVGGRVSSRRGCI